MFAVMFCFSVACTTGNSDSDKSSKENNDNVIENIKFPVTKEDEFPSVDDDSFEYNATSEGLVITKYLGDYKNIAIPKTIENKKVIGIEDFAFAGNIIIEKIIIPEYVQILNMSWFKNCDNLISIKCLGNIQEINAESVSLNELKALLLPNTKVVDSWTYNHLLNENPKLQLIDLSGIKNYNDFPKAENFRERNISLKVNELISNVINNGSVLTVQEDSFLREQRFVVNARENHEINDYLPRIKSEYKSETLSNSMSEVIRSFLAEYEIELPQRLVGYGLDHEYLKESYGERAYEANFANRQSYYYTNSFEKKDLLIEYMYMYIGDSTGSYSSSIVCEYKLNDFEENLKYATGIENVKLI